VANEKTFGVRVSDELNEKIESMAGGNKREWFEKVVALAEIQSVKQGATDYSQDLNELEIHTARIYELVSNMVQRSIYIKESAVQEIADKLEQRESIISEYQKKADIAVLELNQAGESLKAMEQEKEELSKHLESQQATVENNQSLIHEYKEKIDTLSSLVNQYKGYAAENAELKETIATEKESMTAEFQQKESLLVSSVEELKATVHDQEDQIARLTENLNSTIHENTKEMESVKVNHDNELTQLANQKDLEKDRAILEVKQQYQEKLQEVHDQYNERLARLYEKLDTDTKKKPAADKK
jgi:chromosome segregation ATPase